MVVRPVKSIDEDAVCPAIRAEPIAERLTYDLARCRFLWKSRPVDRSGAACSRFQDRRATIESA